ncbi:MAG: homoserine dehydrogenase [Rhodospirillales bacterium]
MSHQNSLQPLKVAIAGLGTVGGGVVKVLTRNADLLARRAGRPVVITAVSARSRGKERGVDLAPYAWFDDAVTMARDADADLIVELVGGSEGPAKALCEAAIAAGRHVVTANKALLAHHGKALAEAAEAKGVSLNYEAAVAGGIPVIKALREGLGGNRASRVYGIMNGTCNYILTAMRTTGRAFDDILAEAQELGYAEADPSFDVDGIDTAHKLAILASVAFGSEVDFDAIHVEGIRQISSLDIAFAEELGYRIKLLGIAQWHNGGIEQRVHPCMVPLEHPIAHIEDVYNAVVTDGDFVDTLMQEGRGAGEGPTASAVVGDILDIARGVSVPTFGVPAGDLLALKTLPMADREGSAYVRLMVRDQPGVFADIAGALRDHEVSMEQVIQRSRNPGEIVPVVLVVHDTRESRLEGALEAIHGIDAVVEKPKLIRIETF